MEQHEVVITGLGLISSLGKSAEINWEEVLKGHTGLAPVPALDEIEKPIYGGQVKEASLPDDLSPKIMNQSKFLNRGGQLGFLAAQEAFQMAAWTESDPPPRERAMYVATGDMTMVGYDFFYSALKEATGGTFRNIDQIRLNKAAIEKVNPFYLLESLNNNPFSFLTAIFNFMGPGTSLASQSPSGSHALEMAYRSIRTGRSTVAMAVGSGSWINEVAFFELEGLGLLSRGRQGIQSYRPLNAKRDGFLPGEGGAALILESLAGARARGARIYGRILGVGNTTQASPRLNVPDQVTLKSMEEALKEGRCHPGDLGFICPHGSGTIKGDRSEMLSLSTLLGPACEDVPICALKAYTGHMGAASDLGEVILSLLALEQGLVPGTLHFETPEPAFSSLRISNQAQPCSKARFLSVSYGLGGQASAVLIESQ
jgi:3-oxoacyl-[acyl-carrier-protein] synthase II